MSNGVDGNRLDRLRRRNRAAGAPMATTMSRSRPANRLRR